MRRKLASSLPGCVADVSSVECDVDLLAVVAAVEVVVTVVISEPPVRTSTTI